MKIHNESLRAMQEAEQRRKPQVQEAGFTALLAEHLGSGQTQKVASGVIPAEQHTELVPPAELAALEVANSTGVASPGLEQDLLAGVGKRMEGVCGSLDSYARLLGQEGQGNLRSAYSLLEQASSEIAGLRADFPAVGEHSPVLAGMMNELEAITAAEVFKFNRGDYL